MEEVLEYNSNLGGQIEKFNALEIEDENKQSLIQSIKAIHFISSENPLLREKGQNQFEEVFNRLFENPSLQEEIKDIFATAQRQLQQTTWQQQMSGLYVLRIEVQKYDCSHERYEEIYNLVKSYLDNQENRIREISCDILAQIGGKDKECFKQLKQYICNYLNEKFEPIDHLPQMNSTLPQQLLNQAEQNIIDSNHQHQVQRYKDTETCQWQTKSNIFIESYIQFFKKTFLLLHSQNQADDFIDEEILLLTSKSSLHIHKHIREASVGLAQVFAQAMNQQHFIQNAQQIANIIARGLSDSFTQVRHQSVKAVKDFFKKCEQCQIHDTFIPQLIYKLCFNIHHPAEGLKNFTRMTWKEVFPVGGRELVSQNAFATTQYYILQSYSRNHEIRQAACICLQEMISNVMNTSEESKQAVRSQYKEILLALINSSRYEPNAIVREESLKCMAKLLEGMADLIDKEERVQIGEVAKYHLADQSNLVKQNAALVLSVIFKQNQNEEEKAEYVKDIQDRLKNVANVEVQPQADQTSTEFNNPSAQFICNAKNRFITEHFEGLVALVKELAYALGKDKSQIIQSLCEIISYNMRNLNFEKNENIKENIWAMYSEILTKTMNKKNTKDLIEDLLDPVFKDFNHEKINVKNAAKDLIRELAKFIGPNILKGRIENKGDLGQVQEYDKLHLI